MPTKLHNYCTNNVIDLKDMAKGWMVNLQICWPKIAPLQGIASGGMCPGAQPFGAHQQFENAFAEI